MLTLVFSIEKVSTNSSPSLPQEKHLEWSLAWQRWIFILCSYIALLSSLPVRSSLGFNNSPTHKRVNSISLKNPHRRKTFITVIFFYFLHYYTGSNVSWSLNTSQIIVWTLILSNTQLHENMYLTHNRNIGFLNGVWGALYLWS